MSFDFDEGSSGESAGPYVSWHAREKLDGSMPSRSFSLRGEDGIENITAQFKKGVVFDVETLKTGWCYSDGTPGVAPEWVWNTTPARFDQPQPPDRGANRWKKGFSIRVAIDKGRPATWSQSGAGSWAGLCSLMRAIKSDDGGGEVVVAAMSDVEEIRFAKGGTSAPVFTIKKWSARPDCLNAEAAEAEAEAEDDDTEF